MMQTGAYAAAQAVATAFWHVGMMLMGSVAISTWLSINTYIKNVMEFVHSIAHAQHASPNYLSLQYVLHAAVSISAQA
jgi:hypothetical protein